MLLQPIEGMKKYNDNTSKIIDIINKRYNKNFNIEKGIIDGGVEEVIDRKDEFINKKVDEMIDKIGNKVGNKVSEKMTEFVSYAVSDVIGIVSLGAIGYSLYHAFRVMFFNNKGNIGEAKPTEKVIFGYFVFFIFRICNALIKIRGGIYGK